MERNGELWGVVLIADGTDIVLHEAFGLADRNRDVANSTGTAFNIASIGKQLTATAVLQLAQRGRLDLDDPAGRWIDGLPGSTGETVTVRHLLRMEAGWGDYMEEAAYREDPKAFRTISDYVELIRTLEPDFAPGSDFAYSNVSYELLGAVIEAATGQSYADALQELVLDPAGMSATGCFVHERTKGRAVPYTENEAGHLVAAYPLMAYRCSPAGGAYSTLEDLLRFQLAATGGQLLDEHHTTLLLNRFAEGVDKAATFKFIGGTEGANAWAETSLETGRTVVVLANLDPPAAEAVALGLLEWLREHPLD